MSFREWGMNETREVLRRWHAEQSARAIASEGALDRKRASPYVDAAKGEQNTPTNGLTKELVAS